MSTLVAPRTTIPREVVTDRGTWAMLMFIATEAMLFVCLFFSYYYLGHAMPKWPPEPPEYKLALVMLAVLLASSVILHEGEKAERRGASGTARRWTGLTIALGLIFVGIQTIEYRNHLQKLQPTSDAYGSIFYTITGFHAAHLVLGLLMLAYVLLLPEVGPGRKPPHRPLHNASLYWHFVDLVWVFIVALLYVIPNLRV
jgi:heme/copper-type cytochrome/quinol oxidase subunit 3